MLDNGCAQGTDAISWEFDWSDVERATRYHLLVEHVDSRIPSIDTFTSVSSYRRVQPGAYVIEANRFNWQWKVEAEVNGVFGSYSKTGTFSVEPLNADCR